LQRITFNGDQLGQASGVDWGYDTHYRRGSASLTRRTASVILFVIPSRRAIALPLVER
jgi:hypothetical protein